jgi:hypothetical protein
MEQLHSIRLSGLIDYLGEAEKTMKCFLLLFFIFSIIVFANGDESLSIIVPSEGNTLGINNETGEIENLTYKTIIDIQESNLFGNIIDIYFPNKLMNCYIFLFKNDNVIYQIAAMPENDIQQERLEDIDLTKFYAIGYYGIIYPDRENMKMFRGPQYQTPFDFLHKISPEQYVSINDIEMMAGISFDTIDKGGFLSPFYLYILKSNNGLLSVLASPSDNKIDSFYMGGWSFIHIE